MKESKWFSAVIVVVLIGVNGASYLLMHAREVSPQLLISLMSALVLLSGLYIVYLNRSRLRSRRQKTIQKSNSGS